MSRKKRNLPDRVKVDTRYKLREVEKFITRMMLDGKKSISERIFYSALDIVAERSGKDSLTVFNQAMSNVRPVFEVRSRRVGGATYQVPIEVQDSRCEILAMRWLVQGARNRSGRSMSERLANELMDAANSTGSAFKKKEDTHRMAEANKAFAHYRW